MYKAILNDNVIINKNLDLSKHCIDLLQGLLTKDYTKRYTFNDCINHPWFSSIDIVKLKKKKLKLPFKPRYTKLKNDEDLSNISKDFFRY